MEGEAEEHEKESNETWMDNTHYYHRKTNEDIRRWFRIPALESALLRQRITWLKKRFEAPEESVQLHAALYGQYEWEEQPTIYAMHKQLTVKAKNLIRLVSL